MGRDFRPQPWQQLIRAFQRMGLAGAARDVAVANEVQLRRVGRIGAHLPRRWRWLPRLAHRSFGALAGYGHRPWRLAWALAALWLACAGFFSLAAERGAMASTVSPPATSEFSALAYSLEHALPFIDLQQRRLWTVVDGPGGPSAWGTGARVVAGLEAGLGWAACGLALLCLVAPLTRSRAAA